MNRGLRRFLMVVTATVFVFVCGLFVYAEGNGDSIKSISYTPYNGDDNNIVELIQDYNIYYDEDDGKTYYNVFFDLGDIITVTWNDENKKPTEYTFTYNEDEDVFRFESEDGGFLENDEFDIVDNQETTPWTECGEYTTTLKYYDKECERKFRIVENPVEKISFATADGEPISLVEGCDGYETDYEEEEDNYYRYFVSYCEIGNTITVKWSQEGKPDTVYTYGYNEEKEADGFFSEDGEQLDEDKLDITDTQDETHWEVGNTYNAQVSFYGRTCDVPVKITKNPIESISFATADGEPISLVEGCDGYEIDCEEEEDKYYRYSVPYRETGNKITVKWSQEGKADTVYTYGYNEKKEESGFFSEEGEPLDEDKLYITDTQDETHWEAGNTYNEQVSFYGRTCDIPIKIVKNPVKSVSFSPADDNTYELIENLDGETYTDEEDKEYFLYNFSCLEKGNKITIEWTDEDKEKTVYTCCVDDEDNWGFYADNGDKLDNDRLKIEYDQDDNHWSNPGEYTVTGYYYGRQFDIKVNVIENPVESISFEPVDGIPTLIEGVDGYTKTGDDEYFHYSTDFDEGDKLTVKWKDSDKGKVVYTYTDTEDGWCFVSEDGEVLPYYGYRLCFEDGQEETHWKTGSEYDVEISYYGQSCTRKFKTAQSSVASISYKRSEDEDIVENVDGLINVDSQGDEYFEYNSYYLKGDVLTVTFGDSSDPVEYTYDDESGKFVAENGDEISTGEIMHYDNQYSNHWDGAGTYNVELTYMGCKCNMTVTVKSNPVESVEFVDVNGGEVTEIEQYDTGHGRWRDYDDDEYFYYNIQFDIGDKLKIKYKNDAEEKTYEYKQIEVEESCYKQCFANTDDPTDIIADKFVATSDTQETNHWNEIGTTYTMYPRIYGIKTATGKSIKLKECPLRLCYGESEEINGAYSKDDSHSLDRSDECVVFLNDMNGYGGVGRTEAMKVVKWEVSNSKCLKLETVNISKDDEINGRMGEADTCVAKVKALRSGNSDLTATLANGDTYTIKFYCGNSNPKEITEDPFEDIAAVEYTGDNITPNLVLKSGFEFEEDDYNVSYDNNINPGTAKVTITFVGDFNGTIEKTFEIKKQSNAYTTTPTNVKDLVYTGESHKLVNEGKAKHGTVVYSLTEDGVYAEDIPQASAADTYKVWYKVEENEFYESIAPASVDVKIDKAENEILQTPHDNRVLYYTGTEQALIEGLSAKYGTVVYSLKQDGEYKAEVPKAKTAGKYTVWYKVDADDNYKAVDTQSVNVSIEKFKIEDGVLSAYYGDDSDVVIPETVETIGSTAFKDNTKIETITIGDNVTIIRSGAFSGCTGLKLVNIPVDQLEKYKTDYAGYFNAARLSMDTLKYEVSNLELVATYATCAKLSWSEYPNVKVTKYEIQRDGVKVGETDKLSYLDCNLTEGTNYSYSVFGVTDAGDRTEAGTIEVKPVGVKFTGIKTAHDKTVTEEANAISITAEKSDKAKDFDGNWISGTLYYIKNENKIEIGDATPQENGNQLIYKVNWDVGAVEDGDYDVVFSVKDPGEGSMETVATLTVDKTKPEKIVNVNAIGDIDHILLSWGQSSEVKSDRYIIYRKAEGDDEFEVLTTITGRTTLSYKDTSVEKKKTYYYKIAAQNKLDTIGTPSDEVSASTVEDNEAPVITKVTPATYKSINGTTEIEITATDNVAVSSAEAYYYDEKQSEDVLIGKSTETNLKIDFDTTVLPDGEYTIKIYASDAAGNKSDAKSLTYKIDNSGPEAVTGLNAKEVLSTKITLEWKDVSDDDRAGFVLEQKKGDDFEVVAKNITTLGYNLSGLEPGEEYIFRVAAVDNLGNKGEYSDEYTVQTIQDTTAPTITELSPEPGRHNNSIQFTASAGDDHGISYIAIETSTDRTNWTEVYRKTFETISKTASCTCEISLADAAEGSLYVRAVAEDFCSNKSDTGESAAFVEYIVDKTAPVKPGDLVVAGGDGYITLGWSQGEEDDIATYSVFRSETEDGEFTLIKSGIAAVNYVDDSVEKGKTYYYKIAVIDSAGNLSEYSDAVSGRMLEDTESPEIDEVLPADNTVLGPDVHTFQAALSDNNKLESALVEYKVNDETEYTTLLDKKNINEASTVISADIPVDDMNDGDVVHIRLSCKDADGNASAETLEYTYNVDKAAPSIKDLKCKLSTNGITITWKDNSDTETDIDRFEIYRIDPSTSRTKVKSCSKRLLSSSYSYEDNLLSENDGQYRYLVVAIDKVGNKREYLSDIIDYENPTTKNKKPVAEISGQTTMEVGVEETFNAYASTDDGQIITYAWNFGDGTTGSGVEVVKKYTATGEYNVKLTVTDECGETDTCTFKVNVQERSNLGTLEISVVDGNGSPIANAPVYFNMGTDKQEKAYANSSGKISYNVTKGDYVIGSYKSGYLPATKTVTAIPNAKRTVTLTLVEEELVTGEFEVTRMTLEEVQAAGIDVYAAENQNFVKAETTITYGKQEYQFSYVRNDKKILQYNVEGNGGTGSSTSSGGSGGGSTGSGGIVGCCYCPNSENKEIIAILTMDNTMSALKDFFDVKLHILNNASSEFVLKNNSVDLTIPSGLTLMSNGIVGGYSTSTHVDFASLAGQDKKTISWILRGDKVGSYDLSATYNGTLANFDEPITATFNTDEPIEVYGLSDVTMEVEVNNKIDYGAFYFNVGMKNNGKVDCYNPNLDVNEKVWNITASALNLKDEEDFCKKCKLLNVRHVMSDGTQEYLTWTKKNGKIDTGLTTLGAGEALFYDYVVYNVLKTDDVAVFREASTEVLEGVCGGVNVSSIEMNLYSKEDSEYKLDSIINSDGAAGDALSYIEDNSNFLASNNSGLSGSTGQIVYNATKFILQADFKALTDDEKEKVVNEYLLDIMTDSVHYDAIDDAVDTQYLNAAKNVFSTISSTARSLSSSGDDDMEGCAKLADNMLKDTDKLKTFGNSIKTHSDSELIDSALEIMGCPIKGAAATQLRLYLSNEGILGNAVTDGLMGVSKYGGMVVEQAYIVSDAINDADRKALMYTLVEQQACKEEAELLLNTVIDFYSDNSYIRKNCNSSTLNDAYDEAEKKNSKMFTIIHDQAKDIKEEIENNSFNYWNEVNNNILKAEGYKLQSAILSSAISKMTGKMNIYYALASTAFAAVDEVAGLGARFSAADSFAAASYIGLAVMSGYDVIETAYRNNSYSGLKGSNLLAGVVDSKETITRHKASVLGLYEIGYLFKIRLLGERSTLQFMSSRAEEEPNAVTRELGVFAGVTTKYGKFQAAKNVISKPYGISTQDVDDVRDYQYEKVLSARDAIFANNASFTLQKQAAPTVTIDYDKLQTKEVFSADYEYCLSDGVWMDCNGEAITIKLGNTTETLRVRAKASASKMAGEITNVTIYAKKEMSKTVNVTYYNNRYVIKGLDSDFMYKICVNDNSSGITVKGGDEITVRGLAETDYLLIKSLKNDKYQVADSETASFKVSKKIHLVANKDGKGTVSGNGWYLPGTDATLTATAADGYWFEGWYIDGERVSRDSSYLIEVREGVSITAKFGKLADTCDHCWDEGKITTKPTDDSKGEKTYTCKKCKITKKEILPANKSLADKLTEINAKFDNLTSESTEVEKLEAKEAVWDVDSSGIEYQLEEGTSGSMATQMKSMEEKIGGVIIDAATDTLTEVSIIGGGLNAIENRTATLVLRTTEDGKAVLKTIPEDIEKSDAKVVSIDLENAEKDEDGNLMVPVLISFELPEGFDAEKLVIVHQSKQDNVESIEYVKPIISKDGEKTIVSIIVTHFSNFVLAEKHEHSLTEVAAKEADCTTAGNLKYWHCEGCDKYFKDADANEEYAENGWVVGALNHSLDEHLAADETCTTAGNSTYYYCNNCKKYFSDANCTQEIIEDSWVIEAHHFWNDGEITKAATATEDGEKTYTCTKCQATRTEVIEKTGGGSSGGGDTGGGSSGGGAGGGGAAETSKTIANATLAKTNYVYTGKAIKPDVTVVDSEGNTLKAGTDYTVAYANNTNPGEATVTVTGIGDYNGSKITLTFTIVKENTITAATLKKDVYEYTGKAIVPTITVTDQDGKTLKKNTDYTVTLKNNKNVGTATVVVSGKGDYEGSVELAFTINPKSVKLASVKAGKKAATVKWKKPGKAYMKQMSGYEISYDTNKAFANAETVKAGRTNVSKTIRKLQSKKNYYFKIRTYKTVGLTKYYSAWSAAKRAKVK